MDLRIIEDYIKAIEHTHFQGFCDRLLLKIYPHDYTPVRAGGKNGDMKNDGYCHISRTFFQAHASRGESAAKIKSKVETDLKGCLEKQRDVQKFIYITNDTLTGEIEHFIDNLRNEHKPLIIETWSPKLIIEKIKDLQEIDIEYIIERSISGNKKNISINGLNNQSNISIEKQINIYTSENSKIELINTVEKILEKEVFIYKNVEKIQHLIKLYEIHKTNLQQAEIASAKWGELVPPIITHTLDDNKQKIENIKQEILKLL